jgi:hypothetical protein
VGDDLPEPSAQFAAPATPTMRTHRYGLFRSRSFRFRLGISFMVWVVFLSALCILAGFRVVPGEKQLHSVVAVWLLSLRRISPGLSRLESYLTICARAMGLFCMLVLPPYAAALASPFMGTGHLPGEREADSSDPRTHRPFLFYWPLWRYLYLDRESSWCALSPLVWWCIAASVVREIGLPIGGLAPNTVDLTSEQTWLNTRAGGLSSGEAMRIYVVWSILFWLLPGVIRRILDWRAARHASVT